MFSYYGSKSKVVDYYPPPKHGLIIEPFAGSARYALKYWDREVILNDKSEVITGIWRWLQECSVDDILRLPDLKKGDKLDAVKFDCQAQRWLMGFISGRGLYMPAATVSEWGETEITRAKKRIIANLHKIKHWKILDGCYSELPNVEATHFIDPPYKKGGHKYVCSSLDIDFEALAHWVDGLRGQVIVCENMRASWMDFKPLVKMQGSMRGSVEAIWSNEPTNYDNVQLAMF